MAKCVNKDDMVNTEDLKALVHQVTLRKSMLMIASDYTVGLPDEPDQLVDDALFDLSRVDPNEAASQIAEDGQLLEELQESLVTMQESMDEKYDGLKEDIGEIKAALGIAKKDEQEFKTSPKKKEV